MISAALAFVIAAGLAQWVIEPALTKIKSLDKAIERREAELKELRRLQSEYLRLLQKTERVRSILEKRKESFTLFSYLESVAERSGVKDRIKYMKPFASTISDEVAEALIEMKLSKVKIEPLIKFLFSLENSGQLIRIKKIRIRPRYTEPELLDVTLVVYTYVLKKKTAT